MDNLMVFDDKTKSRLGAISVVPAICFFLTLLYYLGIMIPALQPHDTNFLAEGITHRYYNILFAMLAVSALVSASVLIYFLVILARMKNLNAPQKMVWVLLLVTFVPIAFMAFWYFLIRREPRYVGIYPNIA